LVCLDNNGNTDGITKIFTMGLTSGYTFGYSGRPAALEPMEKLPSCTRGLGLKGRIAS
jgi:hypothetical protein